MAYTVWGAFEAFRKNSVDLDPDVTKTARASRDYLSEQLKALPSKDPSFPVLSGGYRAFGSFARKTKIWPLNDIDLLLLLNGRGTNEHTPTGDLYERWLYVNDSSAPLNRFASNSFVNSTSVLNKIRDGLALVPNYSKATIKRTGEAAVLNLISHTWVFDIVPALSVVDAYGTTLYFLIPDGSGDWKRTDPRKDQAYLARVCDQHTVNLREVMRFLKYWNHRAHKPRLPSYYFETLVLKVFDYASRQTDWQNALAYFFRNCSMYLWSTCADPKGVGPNLDANISNDTKQKVAEALSNASTFAGLALQYEASTSNKDTVIASRR